MNEPPHSEVVILTRALELTGDQRKAYLDEACGSNADLRQQVEALIRSHEQAAGFLDALAGQVIKPGGPPDVSPTEKPGDKIGNYRLLQQIGEGGCGVVYMAEQEEPVKRRVALKVIKLGMDTKSVIARFEAERQALALMDHPNIAKVLEAGATETGRPYFVMELVRGVKITDYCDANKVPTAERLHLFIQVCQAIQHAHQKGIIHRDIKPSNILVTVNDGVPVPKVIDFGIAKATQGRLTDKTLFTAFEQFIGTPAYMSPEQAVMTSLDIDTRSDIYSLGVLLYELLTGKTPFDANELARAGLDAMRRTILEVEPPKPSTRLSAMQDGERTTTARHRQTESPKLIHLVRGDLDWIVMKSLEKDRARRYETANGFAADIQRHLAEKPVSAGAPSVGYRFTKFVRRNKKALGIGAVLAILTVALLGSMFLVFQEFRAGKYSGITLHTNPEGAEVWRGGQKAGTTPFDLASLPPGEFIYSLVLTNYESVTNTTPLVARVHMNDFTFLRRVEPLGVDAASNPRTNLMELTTIASQGMTILTTEGKVEVGRKGTAGWTMAQPNMVMSVGDRLRTQRSSGAMLLWSDNSVMRISELTTMEISPPATGRIGMPSLKLNSGHIQTFPNHGSTNILRILHGGATVWTTG